MTSFIDGPAAGIALTLRRAPVFLRVVRSPGGDWDALDMLDDEPKPRESVTVYVLTGRPAAACVDGRDRKTGRRFGHRCAIARYRVVDPQPGDEQVRDTAAWRAWCESQRPTVESQLLEPVATPATP